MSFVFTFKLFIFKILLFILQFLKTEHGTNQVVCVSIYAYVRERERERGGDRDRQKYVFEGFKVNSPTKFPYVLYSTV